MIIEGECNNKPPTPKRIVAVKVRYYRLPTEFNWLEEEKNVMMTMKEVLQYSDQGNRYIFFT